MTSPLSSYGGGYYTSPSFPDTPIYDSLVAERGAPQIAPIRVPPPPYETGSMSTLPALPALPALPSASSASSSYTPQHGTYTGYTPAYPPAPQPASYPTYPAPAPYIPQQASGARGYTGGSPQQAPHATQVHATQVPQAPYQGGPGGYNAVRPVPPRPAPPRPAAPGPYGGDQYRRPNNGQSY
ncbi:MAG: hypothetical protein JO362_10600 [Streptomycetaceae bacterium]|nr:hypothetical protein [Streptomycetaceae bacterium]